MSIIYVTDDMFKDCFNTLNSKLDSVGIHEYSQELFSQGGVTLRLESSVECINKVVVDEVAKRSRDKRIADKEKRLRLAAAAVGLSIPKYLEKQHEAVKADRIKKLAEHLNINIDLATAQVEAEELAETKLLKTEFYRKMHPETVNLVEGFSTANIPDEILDGIPMEEFINWRYTRESNLRDETEPTKEVVTVKSVTPLHIVYSFSESLTGISGFDTIAKNSYSISSTLPAVETFKALFKEYINSAEFKNGLSFIGRIAGTTLTVSTK